MSPTSSMDNDTVNSSIVTPDDKQGVKDPGVNDVLCGRGGSVNSHAGNERFRTLVEKRRRVYLTARFKREKRMIASSIVSEIRALNGRFLQRDAKCGLWKDIGDEKAREKTSQALRESAPSIRAEIEVEINEQRAELYKDEPTSHAAAAYPPPPAGSSGYYSSWYPSYYSYASHTPPVPPPHGGHPYPPPPTHSGYPPPPPHYDYRYGSAHPDPYAAPPPPKSTVPEPAGFITSSTESLKNWTKASFSFGGGGSVVADAATVNSTRSRKPISFKHEDRRKMVKFRDENGAGMIHSPSSMGDDDLEPQAVDVDTNTTLMSQVANHILGSLVSWDNVICGTDRTAFDGKVPFPKAQPSAYTQDTDTGVDWEGQEVQLVVDEKKDERLMPPPSLPPRPRDSLAGGGSMAFSSIGSCHSWFPEQIGAAASYFGGRDDSHADHNNNNMDIDYSAAGSIGYTAELHSVGESIGGASLTKVFDHESLSSPNMSSHIRELNQIHSWDRSLRSKSPLSLRDDDDESRISKCSSRGAMSLPSVGDEMAWTRE